MSTINEDSLGNTYTATIVVKFGNGTPDVPIEHTFDIVVSDPCTYAPWTRFFSAGTCEDITTSIFATKVEKSVDLT